MSILVAEGGGFFSNLLNARGISDGFDLEIVAERVDPVEGRTLDDLEARGGAARANDLGPVQAISRSFTPPRSVAGEPARGQAARQRMLGRTLIISRRSALCLTWVVECRAEVIDGHRESGSRSPSTDRPRRGEDRNRRRSCNRTRQRRSSPKPRQRT
jgi:hypothetical protein